MRWTFHWSISTKVGIGEWVLTTGFRAIIFSDQPFSSHKNYMLSMNSIPGRETMISHSWKPWHGHVRPILFPLTSKHLVSSAYLKLISLMWVKQWETPPQFTIFMSGMMWYVYHSQSDGWFMTLFYVLPHEIPWHYTILLFRFFSNVISHHDVTWHDNLHNPMTPSHDQFPPQLPSSKTPAGRCAWPGNGPWSNGVSA